MNAFKDHQFWDLLSNPQQKPTAMQYQEAGQQKVMTTAYKEAYGQGGLTWDYKNGTADRDLFGMGEGRQLVIFRVGVSFLGGRQGRCQAVNGTRTCKNML